MSFADDVKKWTAKASAEPREVMDILADDVFETIKSRTPVDTGTLRDAWVKEATPAGYTIYNPLPYAAVVEYGLFPNPPKGGAGKTVNGFSTQAPAGMVGITVVEIPQKLEEAIRKAQK